MSGGFHWDLRVMQLGLSLLTSFYFSASYNSVSDIIPRPLHSVHAWRIKLTHPSPSWHCHCLPVPFHLSLFPLSSCPREEAPLLCVSTLNPQRMWGAHCLLSRTVPGRTSQNGPEHFLPFHVTTTYWTLCIVLFTHCYSSGKLWVKEAFVSFPGIWSPICHCYIFNHKVLPFKQSLGTEISPDRLKGNAEILPYIKSNTNDKRVNAYSVFYFLFRRQTN